MKDVIVEAEGGSSDVLFRRNLGKCIVDELCVGKSEFDDENVNLTSSTKPDAFILP